MDAADLLRPALWLVRGLWWLAWDVVAHTVGWSIGWLLWRVLTLGHFPREGLGELDRSSPWVAALVELTGLAVLLVAMWQLHQHVLG